MRSDNHINVGRMTEFSSVTWACKYALVVGSLAIERVRVIYRLPISVLVGHSHRQASSCSLLDMRHPIGVASRRSSLLQLPVPRLLDSSICDSLFIFSFRVARTLILTLILIFYTQMNHQTLIRPKRGRLLVRSAPTPY